MAKVWNKWENFFGLIAPFERSNNFPKTGFGFINVFTSISKTIVLQLSHSATTTIAAKLKVLCGVQLDLEGLVILQQRANLSFSLCRLHRNGIFIQCEKAITDREHSRLQGAVNHSVWWSTNACVQCVQFYWTWHVCINYCEKEKLVLLLFNVSRYYLMCFLILCRRLLIRKPKTMNKNREDKKGDNFVMVRLSK